MLTSIERIIRYNDKCEEALLENLEENVHRTLKDNPNRDNT